MPRADALTSLQRFAEELSFFRPHAPVIYRTAHAALDLLGGLSAAAGGTMAQMPLPAYLALAVQFDPEPRLRIRSAQIAPPVGESEVTIPLPASRPHAHWAAGIAALAADLPPATPGASILIHSNIPQGAGQSSSTALLAALALALAEPRQTPAALTIAQHAAAAEAHALLGTAARLDSATIIAALTCLHSRAAGKPRVLRYSAQPHRYVGPVPLPDDVRVLALDTGVRHARPSITGTSSPTSTSGIAGTTSISGHGGATGAAGGGGGDDEFTVAAAMGRRLIETIYSDLGQSHTPLHGYLANTSPLLYRQYFRTLLPRRMRFGDFVRTYGSAGLDFPEADKEKVYRVRTIVDHLIAEHEHAEQFLQAMEELAETSAGGNLARNNSGDHSNSSNTGNSGANAAGSDERQRTLQRAGRLLLASHHSYRLRLELSCPEADWLVDRLMESGPDHGIYGARITGAGGGGTVAALLARSPAATDDLLQTINAYHRTTGLVLGVTEA